MALLSIGRLAAKTGGLVHGALHSLRREAVMLDGLESFFVHADGDISATDVLVRLARLSARENLDRTDYRVAALPGEREEPCPV